MANQQQYWQFEIFGSDPELIGFFGDAGIIIPSGTTLERPASPSMGHIRFNTDLNAFEGYTGIWEPFETGGVTTFDVLPDTPASKAGSANRVLIVNAAETDISYSSALQLEPTGRLRVPAAYEALVDADTVVPNKKYVDDQDNLQLSLSGGAMTGNIAMGGNTITGLPTTPTLSTEAASKFYVDQIASGIDYKESVHMGTIANLPATYDNGAAGFGATLTATVSGVLPPAITDGHAHFVVGTRVLVKEQTDLTENGIYEITDLGSGEEVTEVTTVADIANSLDGTYWTFNDGATAFYVWYDTPAGAGDPAPGGTGIQVSIATAATAEDVKNATIAAINGSAALVVAYDDETDKFYLVNDNTGGATNSTAGTSGFTVTTFIDGTGTPTPWVLTRASDADNSPSNEVSGGMFTLIEDGQILAGTGWVMIEPVGNAILGTDGLEFIQISSGAGTYLPLAGGTMSGSITMGAAGIQVIGDTTTATAPAYSFDGDLGTGLHQTAGASTLSMVIGTASTWNYSATAFTPAVTLTQDIGSTGLKFRNVFADHFRPNFGAAGDPSYSFEGDATTGMYNDGAGGINFAVGGSDALGIESDGTISVDTASYETLVTADNDIPNKLYVDNAVASANTLTDADGDTLIQVEEGADDDTIRMDVGNSSGTHGPIADIFLLSATSFTVIMGTATTDVAGAPIALNAGTGGTTSNGGNLDLAAGNGGATSGAGGYVNIYGGASTGGTGGAVNIGSGVGYGGIADIQILGATPTGNGYDGGDILLQTGDGNGAGGSGGNLGIVGGSGGASGDGGNINITTGAATGAYTGGALTLSTGQGGTTGAGGPVTIQAGGGGSTSGDGGSVTISGGDTNSVSGNTGGSVTLEAGQGSTSDEDGTIVLATQRSGDIETFYGYSETNVSGTTTTLMTIPIPSNDSATFEVVGIARNEADGTAGFKIFGVVENNGGTAIAGSTVTDAANSGGASADWNLTVSASGSDLIVVTDNDAESVDWKIKVRLTSINVPGA